VRRVEGEGELNQPMMKADGIQHQPSHDSLKEIAFGAAEAKAPT